MFLAARNWGISPSEFWEMTMPEWMLIADHEYRQSPEGRAEVKRAGWLEELNMTDEEWKSKHGPS